MSNLVPFNRPCFAENTSTRIVEAFENDHVSGDGAFTREAEQRLEAICGGGRTLLTTSCTHALEMTALLLDLEPGDEVIMPSFTFVSTANAYVLRGAVPVFVDIREDTLNIDETLVEGAITDRTRAIVVVHYSGVACSMEPILDVANRYGIPVIEDNAHGLFGSYKEKPLGSFGLMSTLSFHETKNLSCGEGGALVLNDDSLIERAEVIREKGTNRASFFRGQCDKYTWVDVGSSYVMADVLAAILCAQLEDGKIIQNRRETIWYAYERGLKEWAAKLGVRLPVVPDVCESSWHSFFLILPNRDVRDSVMESLNQSNVNAVFHYLPLHESAMGRRAGRTHQGCPVTTEMSGCLLRLPFFTGMTTDETERVIEQVTRLTF